MNSKTIVHELKTWPQYFRAVLDGSKTFEARFDDREFEVGDVLHLREWSPETKEYTGRDTWRTISYKLSGEFIQDSYCILALAPIHEDIQMLYNELLYAVGNKFPNETRHETALRYIRNAEINSSGEASASR